MAHVTFRTQTSTPVTSVFIGNSTQEYAAVTNTTPQSLSGATPSGLVGGTNEWCVETWVTSCEFEVVLDNGLEIVDSNGLKFWGVVSKKRRA